jgi:serine/threonine protein kinase
MLQAGTQLAQFKIVEKLGEGGMGAVYLPDDQKLHRRVALKTLSAEMFDNAEHKERFVREARTVAQISHGNVMAIYDIDAAVEPSTGKTVQFIVMEYVKGQSLTAYLKGTKIDIASTVRLAKLTG